LGGRVGICGDNSSPPRSSFLVGVALAMCIAPGDIVLVLMAGIVLGFFARGFLDQNLGGEFFWPFARSGGKKHMGSDQTASQR
jgi:hypothetical protein